MELRIKHIAYLGMMVLLLSCKKNEINGNQFASNFLAGSSTFVNNGTYPKLYTCDSTGISPTLRWEGAPSATRSFAITMHHIPPTGDKHVYMVLYDIPSTINSIPEAVNTVGKWGINTVNGQNKYTPPCSVGPGPKVYIITVYALSAAPVISLPPQQITMDVVLNAIAPLKLASSELIVTYTR
jgi:phosphatidylethanolamine-binding protein (PEBP) family uncharacterized protein